MTKTREIKLYGIVQGVGMRPYVAKLAKKLALGGSVCNMGSYVRILLQGDPLSINELLGQLKDNPPARAEITEIEENVIELQHTFEDFKIVDSLPQKGSVLVSPDIALCDDCRAELYDKSNKRYLHPFINCTLCGPRLSIMKNVPYDRVQTTMSDFDMCPECKKEYCDSTNRRYDAQPVCCNECGPRCYILPKTGNVSLYDGLAITEFRRAIAAGKIGAIKGIGGFHICCDATNEDSVLRLRTLKRRPAKPLAVMARDFEVLSREVLIENEAQKELIKGPRKPIVLLRKSPSARSAECVAPDNNKLGIMLPYAPLQELIFAYPDDVDMPELLVMTSGNVSGAPIARTDEDALSQIGNYCDIILSHNREILTRADDSVMDFLEGEPYMIRRSRGYAPLPIKVSKGCKSALGIGGELKNTFCLAKNKMLYPSAYLSDMEDARSVTALRETITRMESLLEIIPNSVCYDMHPRYNTSNVARELDIDNKVEIQHHYAHILSCMAENDESDAVIGVSFDGTGYGEDKSIWGGELLVCDLHDYKRVGHVSEFYQIGGDSASRDGWRNAVCMLYSCESKGYIDDAASIAKRIGLALDVDISNIISLSRKKMGGVISTSVGRLFDAVAAVLGICVESSYEGEAANKLQYHAERFFENNPDYVIEAMTFVGENTEGIIIDTDSIFTYALKQRINGVDIERIAYDFHAIMAQNISEAVNYIRRSTRIHTVALSGGVFQNTLLTSITRRLCTESGLKVLKHSLIPPNDGGICVGQAYYAANN